MEIYERIILLRNELLKDYKGKKYSRNDFAEKIGVTRGVIENIEYNRVEIKDHIIKLICQTFNVNEDWLRNGNEPIFIDKDEDIIQELKKKYQLNDIDLKFLNNFLSLSSEQRQLIYSIFNVKE